MQVKKFEAPTMQEALKVIKREMGPDAIILKTKENRKGFGLMSSTSVEVTVAITENDLRKKSSAERNLPDEVKEKIYNRSASEQKKIYDSYFDKQLGVRKERVELSQQHPVEARNEELVQSRGQVMMGAEGHVEPAARPRRMRQIDPSILDMPGPEESSVTRSTVQMLQPNEESGRLKEEIDELKSLVKQMSRDKVSSRFGSGVGDIINEEISESYRDLINAGIERAFVREILKSAEFSLDEAEKGDYGKMQEKIAYELLERISVVDVLDGVGAKEGKAETTFISVVGPTGVGKTTTVAKIASQAASQRGLRVGLINLDMYRVAAANQLETYAKLMNLPFRNVKSVEELNEAIYDFGSLDLVMIDTTGRSQKDAEGLTEISKYLEQVTDNRALLVLSATTRESELRDISTRFRLFKPCALVFSKLDETGVFGGIVNTQLRTKLPLAYFTVGQRVPEDIERATKERLVDLIVDL